MKLPIIENTSIAIVSRQENPSFVNAVPMIEKKRSGMKIKTIAASNMTMSVVKGLKIYLLMGERIGRGLYQIFVQISTA